MPTKRIFGALMLTVALGLPSCALFAAKRPDVVLRPMQRTPAAEGSIELSSDKNGNTVAELKMKHLPPPALLSPELSTYVVWARPAGQDQFMNVGQVRLDGNRTGNTFVQMPYSSFDLIITAEPGPTAFEPSEYKVLEGSVGGVPGQDASPSPRPQSRESDSNMTPRERGPRDAPAGEAPTPTETPDEAPLTEP